MFYSTHDIKDMILNFLDNYGITEIEDIEEVERLLEITLKEIKEEYQA